MTDPLGAAEQYNREVGRELDDLLDGFFGQRSAIYEAREVSEQILDGTVPIDWIVYWTHIELLRLLDLEKAVEHRKSLREAVLTIIDAEVRAVVDLRTAAGYSSEVRWGADGHVDQHAIVAHLVRWRDWLLDLDDPESLEGWAEYVTAVRAARAASWRVIGPHDRVPNLIPIERAVAVSGKSESTIRRRLRSGQLRRHLVDYLDSPYTDGFDEVEVAQVTRPGVTRKVQVRQGVTALLARLMEREKPRGEGGVSRIN